MIQYLLLTSPRASLPAPPASSPGDLSIAARALDVCSIGVRALDEDHRLLLSVLNHLNDAVLAGFDKQVVRLILHRLVTHTQLHFAREEKFFRETRYPAAAEHEREHLELLRQLLEFQARFEVSSALPPNAMDFLNLWLAAHVQESDSQYTSFLHSSQ